MLIVQVSDIHIVEQGKKTLGVAPMEENLARVINHINQLAPPPDVVLLTGDISDGGTLEQTVNAARILAGLKYPFFVIPGNHDNREVLWSVFQGAACPSRVDAFINYVIDDFDLRLIGIDTIIPDGHGGELCDTRLDWLEARLLEEPNRPTILFMHHPPVKCSVLETDTDGFVGAEILGDLVGRNPNIKRIICGHIHLSTHTCWSGTAVSTAPSIGMRLALDLAMKDPSAYFLDSPAYLLHHWTPEKHLITHTIRIDKTDGPYLFEEAD